ARHTFVQVGHHKPPPFAGLDVLELHHGPELPVEVEHQAVLQVVRRRHGAESFVSRAGVPGRTGRAGARSGQRTSRSFGVVVSRSGAPCAWVPTTRVSSMRTPPRP